jgi:hypothetical protein
MGGCPDYGKTCKPFGSLQFQLAACPQLGATAYFSTTGEVSVGQINSGVAAFSSFVRSIEGGLVGLPLKLVLGSFKTNVNGKAGAAPCVSLVMRPEASVRLMQRMVESAWEKPSAPQYLPDASNGELLLESGSVAAEFYPEETPDEEPPPSEPKFLTKEEA